LKSISPDKLERMIELTLSGLNFEVNRQEFVRSGEGNPVGFDIVARRPGYVAFIDMMPSDRVTVSDIITTLAAVRETPERSSGTFIVTEGRVDPTAFQKARDFGVQIVGVDGLRQALGGWSFTARPAPVTQGTFARKGAVHVRRYLRRTRK
jgi:hypothetical protein